MFKPFLAMTVALLLGAAPAHAQELDGTAFAHPKSMPYEIACSSKGLLQTAVERLQSETIGLAQTLPHGCRPYRPSYSDRSTLIGEEHETETHRYTVVKLVTEGRRGPELLYATMGLRYLGQNI